MELTQKFKNHLETSYEKVFVFDENGDAYFIQIICIDPVFKGQPLLAKSRAILKKLGDMGASVHAISVKGFTPLEWEKERENFKFMTS